MKWILGAVLALAPMQAQIEPTTAPHEQHEEHRIPSDDIVIHISPATLGWLLGTGIPAIIAGGGTFVGLIWRHAQRLKELEIAAVKSKEEEVANAKDREDTKTVVDLMKDRAKVKAINDGIVTEGDNGVLYLDPFWRAKMAAFTPMIQDWYRREGHKVPKESLFLEIQKALGKELMEKVCVPLGWYDYQCLLAATLLCKETQIVEPAAPVAH